MAATQAAKPQLHSQGNRAMVRKRLQWRTFLASSLVVRERVSAALRG